MAWSGTCRWPTPLFGPIRHAISSLAKRDLIFRAAILRVAATCSV
jgi:hypothetical protein